MWGSRASAPPQVPLLGSYLNWNQAKTFANDGVSLAFSVVECRLMVGSKAGAVPLGIPFPAPAPTQLGLRTQHFTIHPAILCGTPKKLGVGPARSLTVQTWKWTSCPV